MDAEELAGKLGEELALMVAEAEAVGGQHPSVAPWSFERRLLPYARALIEAEKALTHAESYAPDWAERPSAALLSLRSLLEKGK